MPDDRRTIQFDAVKKFDELRREYMRLRGAFKSGGVIRTPSGQLLMPQYTPVPKTTWGDCISFSTRYLAATSNEIIKQCIRKYSHSGGWEDVGTVLGCGTTFYESPAYKTALARWEAWTPMAQTLKRYGSTYGGQVILKAAIESKEIYPYNEQFWGYGQRYAIQRQAGGLVLSPAEVFSGGIEAAATAVKKTLGNVANAVKDVVPSLPDLSWLGQAMKWGTIAGGAYLLYWLMKNR